jgi:ParB family transcriptional regulator, chromosome partitioning protein
MRIIVSSTASSGELRTVVNPAELTVEAGFNPRAELAGLDELGASMRRHGILHSLSACQREDRGIALADGHRRLAAAVQTGIERVPVLVRDDLNGPALVASLVTSLKRQDFDPIEEAKHPAG